MYYPKWIQAAILSLTAEHDRIAAQPRWLGACEPRPDAELAGRDFVSDFHRIDFSGGLHFGNPEE